MLGPCSAGARASGRAGWARQRVEVTSLSMSHTKSGEGRVGRQGERELVTCSLRLAVSGDALQLMAELLKIFVVGEQRGPIASSGVPPRLVWTICDPFTFFSEAIKTPFSHFPTSTLSLKISVFQKSQPCLLSCQLAQG